MEIFRSFWHSQAHNYNNYFHKLYETIDTTNGDTVGNVYSLPSTSGRYMAAGWMAAPSGRLAREDESMPPGPDGWIGGREAQPQREALWG